MSEKVELDKVTVSAVGMMVTNLGNEVRNLKAQLKEAERVIEFYADVKNSDFDNQDYWEDAEIVQYFEAYDDDGNAYLTTKETEGSEMWEDYMVGRLAREYKTKYKDKNE